MVFFNIISIENFIEGNDILEKNISIIGGDLRIVKLAKMFAEDEFDVWIYGLEMAEELENSQVVKVCASLQELASKSQLVISSIPLSQDGENIIAPFSREKVSLGDLQACLKNKKFIAGKIPPNIKNDEEIQAVDILENEEYSVLNAIATAEGAIQIAMEEYPKTLSGSKILVMGFGRIGKILAKMLQGIGAKVYCEARKNEDLAYIQGYGYEPVNLKNLAEKLPEFDIIINNIPVQILDQKMLDLLKKDVLIIDLASKPGGVDFEYAKVHNIKTIWAQGLPGKVAPESAAQYIKQVMF